MCCCATSYSSLIGSGQSGEVEEIISLRQRDCIKVNTALPNIFLKICHSLLCVFMASSTNHCDRLLCLSTKAPYFLLPLPSFSLCSPPFLPHSCPFPPFHPDHHLFCLILALSLLFTLFTTLFSSFLPFPSFSPCSPLFFASFLPFPSFSPCSPPFLPHSCPFPHFHPVHHVFGLILAPSLLFALFTTFYASFLPLLSFSPCSPPFLPHSCPFLPFRPVRHFFASFLPSLSFSAFANFSVGCKQK